MAGTGHQTERSRVRSVEAWCWRLQDEGRQAVGRQPAVLEFVVVIASRRRGVPESKGTASERSTLWDNLGQGVVGSGEESGGNSRNHGEE